MISCLMQLIAEELELDGIAGENIIYLDLDKRNFQSIKQAKQLEELIDRLSLAQGMKYLFIDEIQNVSDFEEVLNGFRGEREYSIFITGSNSYLLSGELVTKLTGRYLEFEMYPLTFEEYLGMKEFLGYTISTDITQELDSFISDLHKNGCNIKRETLNRYIQILVDAKILCKCERFDLKSRKSIMGEHKYYLADLSFYFSTNTDNRINYGSVLENVVYIYAKSKGYAVSVGRIGKLECDFILRDGAAFYSYVQVAMTIMNSIETEEREYAPLEKIRDNYPKYLVTRNDLLQQRNGIKHVNIGIFMKEGALFC